MHARLPPSTKIVWLSGPNHSIDYFGSQRLRARHLSYAISNAERDQWLACTGQAMAEGFFGTADWMRDRGEAGENCEPVGAAAQRLRRRASAPTVPRPASISAQVPGSGTAPTASML